MFIENYIALCIFLLVAAAGFISVCLALAAQDRAEAAEKSARELTRENTELREKCNYWRSKASVLEVVADNENNN